MAEWFNATELGSVYHGFESCSWHMITVGLETHIHLKTDRKLFCDCTPEQQTCVICKGLPGTLPRFHVDKVVLGRLLKVLRCNINDTLMFFRKHYYYYDLPNGFQRTQHPQQPLAKDGFLELHGCGKVHIDKVYLEEDPASTLKKGVCYKRAGCPILQIVTSPCFKGPLDVVRKQVKTYLKTLSTLCVDLGICDKKKILKTDVNVSCGGAKYEIKNISSTSAVDRALVLAVPLVKEDYGENKTFHWKNKLIYSRSKINYLFSRQWNIETVDLNIPDLQTPTTLYEVFQMNNEIHKVHRYAFCKRLYDGLKGGTLTVKQVQDLLHMSQVEGFKALDLIDNRSKLSQRLKDHIDRWVVEEHIEKLQYQHKKAVFLEALKRLKRRLVDENIAFSSSAIYEYLDSIYINS